MQTTRLEKYKYLHPIDHPFLPHHSHYLRISIHVFNAFIYLASITIDFINPYQYDYLGVYCHRS